MVASATAFGLWELRSQLATVANTNDGSVHSEMVGFALKRIEGGHLPLTSWYPYLGLGSPQFMHYQSLGAMLAALLGLATGPQHAFSICLYVLLATWPLSIYWSARLLRLGPWAAAGAALCSPLVVSNMGIGYEEISYIYVGFGLWSQLWAMWALPLAWASSWRAVEGDRRFFLPAVLAIAATMAAHFMTGYLAVLVVPLWALLSRRHLLARAGRATVVLAGAGLAGAWVVVPLLVFRPWASVNEALAGGPDATSYGAATALRWLVHGQLLDAGRPAVLTVLAALGGAVALWRARRQTQYRAVLAGSVASLLLFFGRPTWGPLMSLLPGNQDLFLRRFVMGVQLGCVFLAGLGLAAIGQASWHLARLAHTRATASLGRPSPALAGPSPAHALGPPRYLSLGFAALAVAALAGGLAPAWSGVASRDNDNARYISAQQRADATEGRQLARLVGIVRHLGGGRVYAGMPTNWGANFTIGAVPVFRYLAFLDVDEVGFTLRTASLMDDPETYFSESNPADYDIFGVRFLILPSGQEPAVTARLVAQAGRFALWSRGWARYVRVVSTVGPPITANRADLGTRTAFFVASPMAAHNVYPTMAYQGAPAATPTSSASEEATSPGRTVSEQDSPASGRFSATVVAKRTAVVLLSASFDPGWHAWVDGRPRPVQMVAPALVGVRVGPGKHRVQFAYVGYRSYPLLFGLGWAALAGLAIGSYLRWPKRAAGLAGK